MPVTKEKFNALRCRENRFFLKGTDFFLTSFVKNKSVPFFFLRGCKKSCDNLHIGNETSGAIAPTIPNKKPSPGTMPDEGCI